MADDTKTFDPTFDLSVDASGHHSGSDTHLEDTASGIASGSTPHVTDTEDNWVPGFFGLGHLFNRVAAAITRNVKKGAREVSNFVHATGEAYVKNVLGVDAKQNIRNVVQAAVNIYGNDMVRARLAVAQAVLESGLTGKPSGLARHNNFFGIKGSGTAGTVNMMTSEYRGGWVRESAGFAANATAEDSFRQHAELLRRTRYRSVMSATSLEDAAYAVQHSGYATDPTYAEKLIAIDRTISSFTGDISPASAVANAAPGSSLDRVATATPLSRRRRGDPRLPQGAQGVAVAAAARPTGHPGQRLAAAGPNVPGVHGASG